MARVPDLGPVCAQARPEDVTVADLIDYRRRKERLIRRAATVTLPTEVRRLQGGGLRVGGGRQPHVALVMGDPAGQRDVWCASTASASPATSSARCAATAASSSPGHAAASRPRARASWSTCARRAAASAWSTSCRPTSCRSRAWTPSRPTCSWASPADQRDYGIGAQILADLGLRKMRIMTNNPKKIVALEGYGLKVIVPNPSRSAARRQRCYLGTKRDKMGHLLEHGACSAGTRAEGTTSSQRSRS